ncbi:MAG TPA: hypothetical protein VFW13_08245 [Phenylobacterium sp.]|nr:hypothetical protein [Phenylobacterium sp.]
MTPFLALVITGFVVFMAVLGFVWIRGYIDDARQGRAASKALADQGVVD